MAQEFSVWAPECASVDVVVGGADKDGRVGGADKDGRVGGADKDGRVGGADKDGRVGGADAFGGVGGVAHPLVAEGGGWWRASVAGVGPGTDYAFVLDGGEPLPDPRSLRQPHGVHAPSQVFDPAAFAWTDGGWTGRALPGSVLYECHIGTFTPEGTFDGAISRLDHLVDLGVDLVEVMPVNAFDGSRGWGYDGVLWYAVTENYGGPEAFQRFVDACHARGLGVVLDVVHNHLGPSGAYLDHFGPYFGGANDWGQALNLDGPGSDTVRRYILDNLALWWRDFHVDALRLDAVHALRDTRALPLLEEMASETQRWATALRRPLTLIAESDLNDPRLVTPVEGGGYGLDAQWCDDVHHALHATLTGETQGYYADFGDLGVLAGVLRHPFHHAGTWSTFRGRTHGRPVDLARTPGHRFVVYLSDHDQVGNRAGGDRPSATLSPGLLACGAALVLCSPYTPMIFMGEEWGARTPWAFFVGFDDPGLQDAVRTGRRAEFAEHGWGSGEVPDPTDPATFERSRLDWSERDQGHHAWLLGVYRDLIALRRAEPELSDPRLDRVHVDHDAAARTLVLCRGSLCLVVNLSGVEVVVAVDGVTGTAYSPFDVGVSEGAAVLPAESFAVLRTA